MKTRTTTKRKSTSPLIARFQGPNGTRHRIETIARQQIVGGNTAIATALNAAADLEQIGAIAPGNVCIEQGSTDTDVYLILAGKVSVCVHGREVAVRRSGQHVGEMALLDSSQSRCASISALETTVVAKINEPDFTRIANKFPALWRGLARELSERLRERNKFVNEPNPRPVLFIGSSAERRDIAQEIRDGLSYENLLPKVWTDDLFRPSATSIENLERQLEAADFAAMVITPDDMVTSRHRKKPAPRDNIIWEHGLFLGGLGRERVYIVKPRGVDLKLPYDLFGVTPLEYDPCGTTSDLRARLGPVINGILKEINRLGPK
jgi:predicted nucleotide-binding protein